jgi:hypothetical protein
MQDEEFEHLDSSALPDASLPPEQLAASEEEQTAPLLKENDTIQQEPEITSEAQETSSVERTTTATTTFYLLPDVFALVRLPVQIQRLPDFIWKSSFYTISRSDDEISLVCEERLVVWNLDHYGLGNFARIDGNWRILRLGVMDLSLVGVAARFSSVLADADVNINIISTYDTDYVMVKQGKLTRALHALREAGYDINTKPQ